MEFLKELRRVGCGHKKHVPPEFILEGIKMGSVYRHKCPNCKKTTLFTKPLYTIPIETLDKRIEVKKSKDV